VDNHEEEEKEEQVEHIEPPTTPSLSNDMEMSTEAHSFITIPFETLHETQAPLIQCLKEPFYMPRLSRIYANKRANLGTIVPRRSFLASRLATSDGGTSF
jgi:hypothetical protein